MRIAPPLRAILRFRGFATGQPSEFGSNHDQRKTLLLTALQQRGVGFRQGTGTPLLARGRQVCERLRECRAA
jgi:hypothetical protein